MIWKDADSWEMRDDPTDEISKARNKAVGSDTTITYAADGAQHMVTVNGNIRIEGNSTPCVFRRIEKRRKDKNVLMRF